MSRTTMAGQFDTKILTSFNFQACDDYHGYRLSYSDFALLSSYIRKCEEEKIELRSKLAKKEIVELKPIATGFGFFKIHKQKLPGE